jgi:hypothetical protein
MNVSDQTHLKPAVALAFNMIMASLGEILDKRAQFRGNGFR